MNDQNLRNAFIEIANEEVPADMDLWSDIQAQLEKPTNQKNRFVMNFARIAIALFAIASFSVVGYALYQTIPDQSLSEDIITPLNLSQTIDDVTVTLEWAYADVNRIAVQYTTEYPKDINPLTYYDVELLDTDGNSIPSAFGGGGGGGGGGNPDEPMRIMSNMNFDPAGIISFANNGEDEIDLILKVKVANGQYAVPTFKNDLMRTEGGIPGGVGTGYSGGGGGSNADAPTPDPDAPTPAGGGADSIPPMTIPTAVPEDALVREFMFEFTLPVYPEISVDVRSDIAPITDNGLTVTLKELSYTPSSTEATLCFRGVPTPEGAWMPYVTVTNSSQPDTIANSRITPFDENFCSTTTSFILLRPDAQSITVEVKHLESYLNAEYPDASPEAYVARLEARGVYMKVTEFPEGGVSMEIDEERTDMSLDISVIIQEVQLEQQPKPELYEGEWVFEVPIN